MVMTSTKHRMKAKSNPRSAEGGGYPPQQYQNLNYNPLMTSDAFQIYLLQQILDELKKLNR